MRWPISAMARVVTEAVNHEVTQVREATMNAKPKTTDMKLAPRGVPFRVTPENVVAWKGQSGVRARGVLVDAIGQFNPNKRPNASNFDVFANAIARDNAGTEAIEYTAVIRAIRNRPRLKALIGGAA